MLVASIFYPFNPLPNNKILDQPKFEAFADNIKVTEKLKFV